MRYSLVLVFLILGGMSSDVFAQNKLRSPLQRTLLDTQRNIAYGKDNLQKLDIYSPQQAKNAPVMVFVHGGAWRFGDKAGVGNKAKSFTDAGWIYVSINYRLLPQGKHPRNVEDVASALAWVHSHIKKHGGDPNSIFLMGHSAGAHLAALVATDGSYLKDAGKSLGIIQGVIALDTKAYNIPEVIKNVRIATVYQDVFGLDKKTQQLSSPYYQVAKSQGIPPFLIFYTAGMGFRTETYRKDSAYSFAKVLNNAGVEAEVVDASDRRHSQINQRFGEADDEKVTVPAMDFLEKIRGKKNPPRNNRTDRPLTLEQMENVYESREFKGMPYRLLRPIDWTADSDKTYPVILSLHGAGGRGTDNKKNLKSYNGVLATETLRTKYPCFVVVPQSPTAWRTPGSLPEFTDQLVASLPVAWQKLIVKSKTWFVDDPRGKLGITFELLDALEDEFNIDSQRIYVLGHSMGGFGSFEAIATNPKRFAAAIPSAGGLSPWHDLKSITQTPIWAFHGDQDTQVPTALTQWAFGEMKKLGGNMKYTELGGVKHNASSYAFIYTGDEMNPKFVTHYSSDQCDKTSNIWDWLFAQKLK